MRLRIDHKVRNDRGGYSMRIKRALDLILATLALVVTAPVSILGAIIIKLEDRGPLLYRQLRYGRAMEPFVLYKLRTMSPASTGSSGDASSVTRVGRVLRATGIDEIPQFVNILKGDMSLVGPRPLAVDELVDMGEGRLVDYPEIPGFEARSQVPPGLTGMATIYLPKTASPATKIDYDLRYVRERHFWLDLRLILLSIWVSLRGRWEAGDPKLSPPGGTG